MSIRFPTLHMTNFHPWSLKEAVNHLEDAIITISGPALAISGIIAGLDLITGGTVLKDSPNLGMTWAICLLLSLDFQVLCLGVRAHRIYRRPGDGSLREWFRKAGELLLCIAIAAAISYVSIQMQSIVALVSTNKDTTVYAAEAALGINGNALIWERSSLVLVLIFLSGWSRGSEEIREPAQVDTPAPATPTPLPAPVPAQPPVDLEALLRAMDERTDRKLEIVVREVRATLEQVTASIPAIAAQDEQRALPSGEAVDNLESIGQATSEHEIRVDNLESISQEVQPIYPRQFESKEQAIIEACRLNPGASPEQIALIVACSPKTALRWMDKHAVAY